MGYYNKFNKLDIVGKKFYDLEVIEYLGLNNNLHYYICKCICGNIRNICRSDLLRKNEKGAKRCAQCRHKITGRSKHNKMIYKYADPKISSYISILKSYRWGATKRKLSFNLNLETLIHLINSNCRYCGIIPSTIRNPLFKKNYSEERYSQGTIIYNGIDRVDNLIGYEPGNMVPCCSFCNRAKNNSNVEDFLAWAKRIYINNQK